MRTSEDGPETPGGNWMVLACYRRCSTSPDVPDAVPKGEIRMVRECGSHIATANHDVWPKVGRRLRVVHPHPERAPVFVELLENPLDVLPRSGVVSVRVQAIDVPAADHG